MNESRGGTPSETSAGNRKSPFQALAEEFLKRSEEIAKGKGGKDYAVLSSELEGYENTELESALWGCENPIAEALEKDSSCLTPEALGAILRGLVNLGPAVTGYRARLMRYAGDYGDESSPMADLTKRLLDDVSKALRRLGPRGGEILAGVPKEVLESQVTVYYTIEACEMADIKETISYHLDHM